MVSLFGLVDEPDLLPSRCSFSCLRIVRVLRTVVFDFEDVCVSKYKCNPSGSF